MLDLSIPTKEKRSRTTFINDARIRDEFFHHNHHFSLNPVTSVLSRDTSSEGPRLPFHSAPEWAARAAEGRRRGGGGAAADGFDRWPMARRCRSRHHAVDLAVTRVPRSGCTGVDAARGCRPALQVRRDGSQDGLVAGHMAGRMASRVGKVVSFSISMNFDLLLFELFDCKE